MLPLLKWFWGICLLRVAPQDLPTSQMLMTASLLCYFLVSLLVAWLQLTSAVFVPAALLDTACLVAFTVAALWVPSFMHRFTQTLTALAGSGAILGVVALPVLLWQKQIGGADTGFTLPTLLILLWTAWNIVVVGHVLRHALSTLFAFGIALAVVYMYIASRLAQVLFFR